MANKYIDVRVGEIYLKKIFLSVGADIDNLDITEFEIEYAETWAENRIESRLGLAFEVYPATPLIIRDIALMLTGHKIRQFVVTANSPNLDDHTERLLEEADEAINDIYHGRRGVYYPDGSVHPRYPGPSNGERFVEQNPDGDILFMTNLDRPFVSMEARGTHPDGPYIDNVYHEPDGRASGGRNPCTGCHDNCGC